MNDHDKRFTARELAASHLKRGDALGWFEALYAQADGDDARIPWADLRPHPGLIAWLDATRADGRDRRALKIGCGLGDDAEALAARGFAVTAHDISPTAVAWCRRRFPESPVDYQVMDLFRAPEAWRGAFDFVFEANTLQVLPPELRPDAVRAIASFVAPGGTLLIIARGRDPKDDRGSMPWPLLRKEVELFAAQGLTPDGFEDFMDEETPPVRRFRAVFRR